MTNLTGRVVVMTGATGGLGRVVAHAFGEQGATLALLSSDVAKLEALVNELKLPAERCFTHAADLRDREAVQQAAQAVVDKLGAAHIVLHLVGGWMGGKTLVEMDQDNLKAMLDQHVWTTLNVIQAFAPRVAASGWGRFIIVSSPTATSPAAKSGAYAVAKAAQEAMFLTLAQEVEAGKVTANILQVRTIDVEHKRDKEPAPSNVNWTTPEEIAATMLYLCSETAGVVNGARLGLSRGK